MKIKPLHDRVVIKRMEEERMSSGGIVIPDSATEKPLRGVVLSIGRGKVSETGEVLPLAVQVGDDVLFAKYSGSEFKIDSEDFLMIREDDIMAILDK